MELKYFDLISGTPIYIDGIGHFRSPYLYELRQDNIGYFKYNLYLRFFSWTKEEVLKYAKLSYAKGAEAMGELLNNISIFDVLTLVDSSLNILMEAIKFFSSDEVKWDSTKREFVFMDKRTLDMVGKLNKDNFEELKSAILQLNYIKLQKQQANKPTGEINKDVEDKWKKAQEFLEKQSKKDDEENSPYSMANIISKLCIATNSYNLLNIYNLTVFQLYDQFFQYSYLRNMDLGDRVYTIHGGKEHDPGDWVKKVKK